MSIVWRLKSHIIDTFLWYSKSIIFKLSFSIICNKYVYRFYEIVRDKANDTKVHKLKLRDNTVCWDVSFDNE